MNCCKESVFTDRQADLDRQDHTSKKRGRMKKIWRCPVCYRQLCSKFSLTQHLEKVCTQVQSESESTGSTNKKIMEMENKLREMDAKIKTTTAPVNNTLNIICVTPNDNYLDMLTNKIGDFTKAIDYVKECALSDMIGDCKLIERIYFDQCDNAIVYADKKKTKLKYYNEKREEVVESNDAFVRKIANNLQNTYLKGINHLINKNLESKGCPGKFLETYDIMSWNSHIYSLSDEHYRYKMLNQLDIQLQ
jgi:hypothetical protein